MPQVTTPEMHIRAVPTHEIKPYGNNPRQNAKGVEAVKKSMLQFGVRAPILLDKDGFIIYGHTRYQAAVELGLETYPCIDAVDLTDEQARAYRIADNHVADQSEWDPDKLRLELAALDPLHFELLPILEMAPLEFMPAGLPIAEKRVEFTAKDGAKEVDPSEVQKFQHKCPRCSFEFNDYAGS